MKEMMKNTRVFGIDLGTGNRRGGYMDELGRPKIIPDEDGNLLTPSLTYVGKDLDEILDGYPAKNMGKVEPGRVVRECKRDVGTDRVYFEEVGVQITPLWCQSQQLIAFRKAAVKFTGDERAATYAVITVPANFHERQRQSVERSAADAGFEAVHLINEPTAAAVAFGVNNKPGDRTILVEDIGSGTYDVTIARSSGDQSEVLATAGDPHLGGKDVDERIYLRVIEKFASEHGMEVCPDSHPVECFNLMEDVVRAKHGLLSREEAQILARIDNRVVEDRLTRSELERMVADLSDRIEKVTREALCAANLSPEEITHVLLVGGSSRLLAFRKPIERMFDPKKIVGGQVSPDLAVAEGAIIMAAKHAAREGFQLVDERLEAIPMPMGKLADVLSNSVSVVVQDKVSSGLYASVVVPKNTPIPCERTRMYGSVTHEQTHFQVSLVQGEQGTPMEDCVVVAQKELVLPPRDPSVKSLEVSMACNASGRVNVRFFDHISKQSEDITFDHFARS